MAPISVADDAQLGCPWSYVGLGAKILWTSMISTSG